MQSLLKRSIQSAMVVGVLGMADAKAAEAVQFSGDGNETTAPFTMDQPWRVEWRSAGRRLEIILVQKGSEVESWLANLVGPGSGSTHYVQPGTYFFEVNAWGPWTIEVHPMPDPGTQSESPATVRNPP